MPVDSEPRKARHEVFSLQVLQFIDASLVWLSFWLASILRDPVADFARPYLQRFGTDVPLVVQPLSQIVLILIVTILTMPFILETFGFYRQSATKTTAASFKQILKSLIVVGLLIGVVVIFFKIANNSRLILGTAILISALFLLIRDVCVRLYLRRRSSVDGMKEQVVLAGRPDDLDDLLASFPAETTQFWNIVEHFDLSQRDANELDEVLKAHSVSRVIFAAMDVEFQKVARAAEVCELQGVEAWIRASFIRANVARPEVDVLGGQPMLVLRSTPELSWALLTKEVFDRVGAFLLIIATSLFWIPAMIGIMIVSPGASPFFKQKRAGRYGRPFNMWKLRTMVVDAEALLDKLKKEQGNEMDGPVFKLQDDPRVFKFGRLLRKLSIDELPQLFNVLLGDMSLVGPRPLPIYEVEKFEQSRHRRRLSMKPGITCIWQAGGRNSITSFEDWVRMDLEYIDNWSLALDLKLLLKTIPAVVFAKGAK